MSTIRHQNLARLTLDNPHLMKKGEKGKLVEMGGYGKSVQKTPNKVLESKGYLEELAKFGLTPDLISTALVEDIKKKKYNRVGELRLGAEILKMKDNEPKGNNYQFNFFESEQLKRIARRIQNGDSTSEKSPD